MKQGKNDSPQTNLPVRTVYPEHALLSNCLILPLFLLTRIKEFSFSVMNH